MKRILLLVTIAGLFSCTSQTKNTSADADSAGADTVVTTDTTAAKPETASADSSKSASKPASKWEYSENEDKMTSKKKFYASIDANELLQFDFPYDGGVTATLTVRHQSGENEALLQVSKGQFNTGVDGTTIKIRVDSEPAVSYSASGPSDGSSEVLFIENAGKLIRKMKTAKKVLVEAEFYDSGSRVMEFDVDGFKWDHK